MHNSLFSSSHQFSIVTIITFLLSASAVSLPPCVLQTSIMDSEELIYIHNNLECKKYFRRSWSCTYWDRVLFSSHPYIGMHYCASHVAKQQSVVIVARCLDRPFS